MWLVSTSVMVCVPQCGSIDGGSPRLPILSTPPFFCALASDATPATRTATAARAMPSRRAGRGMVVLLSRRVTVRCASLQRRLSEAGGAQWSPNHPLASTAPRRHTSGSAAPYQAIRRCDRSANHRATGDVTEEDGSQFVVG